jgi:hypothetical protein
MKFGDSKHRNDLACKPAEIAFKRARLHVFTSHCQMHNARKYSHCFGARRPPQHSAYDSTLSTPSQEPASISHTSSIACPKFLFSFAAMASTQIDDEDLHPRYCVPVQSLTAPIEVGAIGYVLSTRDSGAPRVHPLTTCPRRRSTRAGTSAFFAWPPFGPLLFDNESSDARDHCANERSTFAPAACYTPGPWSLTLVHTRSVPVVLATFDDNGCGVHCHHAVFPRQAPAERF